jgi:hypothetical protein
VILDLEIGNSKLETGDLKLDKRDRTCGPEEILAVNRLPVSKSQI